MKNALTKPEQAELAELESVIEKGKKSFVEVGNALVRVRDRKLYLQDYESFDEYCKMRWGFHKSRVYQLMEAAVVVQSLPRQTSTIVETESQARELAKVPPEKREEVVKKAARNGKVTAKAIASAARATPQPKQEEAVELCETGVEIPKDILPLWHRMKEAQEVVTSISRIKSTLKKAQEEDDPLWREVDHNRAIAELSGLFTHLSTGKPYAVCTVCNGVNPARGKCTYCRGRGFISKFRYDTSATEKAKKFRKVK